MLETREQATITGGHKVDVRLKTEGSASPWNPPMWIPTPDDEFNQFGYIAPIKRESYEKLWTDNSPNPAKSWKRCQHYKRYLFNPRFADSVDCRPVMQTYTGYGLYYVNDHSPNGFVSENSSNSGNPEDYNSFSKSRPVPPDLAYANGANHSAWGPYGNHISGYQSLMADQPDGGFLPPPSDLGTLKDQSLWAMLPTIKSELSLVNSIIELRDFKSLPKTLANIGRFTSDVFDKLSKTQTKRVQGRLRDTFSKDHGPTLREATSVGADAYLQTQFNILPFLSDISGISTALSKIHKQINRLLTQQGKKQRRHFTKKVDLLTPAMQAEQTRSNFVPDYSVFGATYRPGQSYNDIGTQFDGYYGPGPAPGGGNVTGLDKRWKSSFVARRAISHYNGVFHAQIEYDYSYSKFQVEYASILGLLDALGVNLDPSIIWNAIPWSFVVDWVIGVNRFLGNRKVLNMEPTTNIHRYLWSWKTVRITRLTLEGSSSPLPHRNMTRVELSPLIETTYRRDLGVPTENSLITSGLSLREISLAAALLVPKGWRRSRASSTRSR